ncbi:MAG: MMPL family transporter, partial [Gaiellaceae bacterium]
MNLAARAGRWSAAHWKTATLAWIGLVVAAIVAGSAIGTRSLTTAEAAQGDTARAETMLARAGFRTPAGESILVRGQAAAPGDPTFRATVRDLLAALRPLPQVERIRSGAVSKDGRSELVSFDVAGNPDSADTRIQPVLDAVAGVQRAHPSFTIAEVGMASANHAANQVIEQDLSRAERLSVPITFLILLIAFGAFVAAGIP